MTKYFLLLQAVSRSKGSRLTRAVAYRTGERIRDERTNTHGAGGSEAHTASGESSDEWG
jgi:hypothetical protein